MIAIIDYGMGNLKSVQKAFEAVGADVLVTNNEQHINNAKKIVLPGVGAFGDAVLNLKKLRILECIKNNIKSGKFFLGLCLGMQLLFEKSKESPKEKGLGIFDGEVIGFNFKGNNNSSLKIPHIGWNQIKKTYQCDIKNDILSDVNDDSFVYFVHSFYVALEDTKIAYTTTQYGVSFTSSIAKENVFGFQFHPEKSQGVGLKIIKKFVTIK